MNEEYRRAALREIPRGPRRHKDNVVLDAHGYVLCLCPGPDGWRTARAIAYALELAERVAAGTHVIAVVQKDGGK